MVSSMKHDPINQHKIRRACQNYKVTQEAHIADYARFLNLKQLGVTYMKYLASIATPPNIYRHYSFSIQLCEER